MPHLNLTMTQAGPLIDVWVSVSGSRRDALLKAGKSVPDPVKARALIDTGATCSTVDPAIIDRLGIPVTGISQMLTPSTGDSPHICNQYDVLIAILDLNGKTLFLGDSVPVVEVALAAQGIDLLLGRDVLGHAVFIYNGPAGVFTLSY